MRDFQKRGQFRGNVWSRDEWTKFIAVEGVCEAKMMIIMCKIHINN